MRILTRMAFAALVCACARAEDPDFPPIGLIDFHGLRSHTEAEVRKLLPFKEGDAIPSEPPDTLSGSIARALNVPRVEPSYVCCTPDQKMIVFIGVAETEPPAWLATPTGSARLPDEMIRDYQEFMSIVFDLIKSGKQAPSNHSQGHYLDTHPPLRAIQDRFVAFASGESALLQQVLTESSDVTHRAVAAMIAGYLADKAVAAKVLARAASDPDSGVRNNATRALAIIAEYALAHPERKISIDARPFIDMLNSPHFTDLNKGIWALTSLTASRDPALLAELRQKARPALLDICRWKSSRHADAGCVVLRRVEGLRDRPGPEGRAEVLRFIDAAASANRVGADGRNPP